MQKSQEGLLQSLLFQILSQYPELIPQACSARWNSSPYLSYGATETWTRVELLRSLEAIGHQDQQPLCFCFFIDGLDEYDGDHSDIIDIVKKLSCFPAFKFCVSSRPWTVFFDAFGDSQWQLQVQNLTRSDIRLYVGESFEEHPLFQKLGFQDPVGSEYLVGEIVDRAEGVFLWVFLVVRSLLRGLSSQDEITDLKRRLHDLPADLEKYFKHIFNSIENVYQQRTAQIFQLMMHAKSPLTILAYHFFDQEQEEAGYHLNLKIKPLLEEDIVTIVERNRRHIHARCRDLLEISDNPEESICFRYSVSFLHRTVADFLRTKDMHELLRSWSGEGFRPNACLGRSFLAQLKVIPPDHKATDPDFQVLVGNIIMHALEEETNNNVAEITLLDELDKVASSICGPGNHWCAEFIGNIFGRMFSDNNVDFLDFMVECGLHLYTANKLDKFPERVRVVSHHPLLLKALFPVSLDPYPSPARLINLNMLHMLLNRGANPNQPISPSRKVTVWGWFISFWRSSTKQRRPLDGHLPPHNSPANSFLRLESQINIADLEQRISRPLYIRDVKIRSNMFEVCGVMIAHGAERLDFLDTTLGNSFTPAEVQNLLGKFSNTGPKPTIMDLDGSTYSVTPRRIITRLMRGWK